MAKLVLLTPLQSPTWSIASGRKGHKTSPRYHQSDEMKNVSYYYYAHHAHIDIYSYENLRFQQFLSSWDIFTIDSWAYWKLKANRKIWRRSRACQSFKIFLKLIWNCFMMCPAAVKVSVENAVESAVSRYEYHFTNKSYISIIQRNWMKWWPLKNWTDEIAEVSFSINLMFWSLFAHQSAAFCRYDAFTFGRKQTMICLGYEEAKKIKASCLGPKLEEELGKTSVFLNPIVGKIPIQIMVKFPKSRA